MSRAVTQKKTKAEREEEKIAAKRAKRDQSAASRKGARTRKQAVAIATEKAVIEAKERDFYCCQFPGCWKSRRHGYTMIGSHGFTGRRSAFNDPMDPNGIITFCLEHEAMFAANKSNRTRIEWLVHECKKAASIFGLGVMQMYKLACWMAERCGIEISSLTENTPR